MSNRATILIFTKREIPGEDLTILENKLLAYQERGQFPVHRSGDIWTFESLVDVQEVVNGHTKSSNSMENVLHA